MIVNLDSLTSILPKSVGSIVEIAAHLQELMPEIGFHDAGDTNESLWFADCPFCGGGGFEFKLSSGAWATCCCGMTGTADSIHRICEHRSTANKTAQEMGGALYGPIGEGLIAND